MQQWVFLADSCVAGLAVDSGVAGLITDSGVAELVDGKAARGGMTSPTGNAEPKRQEVASAQPPPPPPPLSDLAGDPNEASAQPPPPPPALPSAHTADPHGSRWGGGHLLAVRICGTPERVEFVPAERMAAVPPLPPQQRPAAVASAISSGASSALQLMAFRHLVLEGYDEKQRVWQVGLERASEQVVRRRTCL